MTILYSIGIWEDYNLKRIVCVEYGHFKLINPRSDVRLKPIQVSDYPGRRTFMPQVIMEFSGVCEGPYSRRDELSHLF